jgi:hypothetical protein
MEYVRSFLIGALVLSACSSSSPRTTGAGTGGETQTGGAGGGEAGGSGGSTSGTGGKSATGGSPGSGGDSATGGSPGTGGSVATGGSPGTGGQNATGGSGGVIPDAGGGPDGAAGDAQPALMECPKPSVDRFTAWNATGEGTTKPMSGSLLVKEGDHYVAKEEFVGSGWHVLELFLGNTFDFMVDFGQSSGFTLTYSSTNDLWLQLRPAFHYDGGAQWVTKIPSTNGQKVTQTFSFDPTKWVTIDLGKPTWTYDMARKASRGFLFVGDKPNLIAFYSLRIDGYVPMCR